MDLADILVEKCVLVCSGAETKHGVLRKLAEQAAGPAERPVDDLFAALNERELLGSTGLGNGLAVPHGRLGGLKKIVAAFAKLERPVDFDSHDDRPVDLVMMLLAPVGAGADHLKALAQVARLLRSDSVAEGLRAANAPADIYALLTGSSKVA